MHLSQLQLDPGQRVVQRDLGSPYELHRTLLRAFPGAEEGGAGKMLFRVEPSREGGPIVVLVQSATAPDWQRLPKGYAQRIDTKVVHYLPLEKCTSATGMEVVVPVAMGDRLRFRLLANPTIKRDGKRHAVRSEEAQLEWLIRKGRVGGFEVKSSEVVVVPCGKSQSNRVDRYHGNRARVTLEGVRFEGVLRVVNTEQFVDTLEEGIGSAKGFGYGLLSVGRAEGGR